ncbi:hypothetical protein TEA_001710 [Camellia sinensis var. sinensis]|uniref:4a-hydroxytetrahydrobiopterin dehydratase n=1 Tax=Camellia sinensis var. sinensis TaxID=542762 RepID=A0A4S4D3Z0_CAMSN|nr:hypothetical protein TEA_001710 [Camellia sinensis var. sinensis]
MNFEAYRKPDVLISFSWDARLRHLLAIMPYLSTKKCVSCSSGDMRPMTEQAANQLIQQVPEWNLTNDGGTMKLSRSWKVKTFLKGLEFFQAVANVAEGEGHHPDLHLVGWNNVKIDIWTHSVEISYLMRRVSYDGSKVFLADPELEAIRQRRMQELMAQHGMGNQQNSEQQNSQEEAKREADERRQMMLSQILSSEARERLRAWSLSIRLISFPTERTSLTMCTALKSILMLPCQPRIVALCGRRENSRVAWSAGSMVLASKRSMSCIEISVARIALVKPEKARAVEDVILRAAQMGQIVEKIQRRRSVLEDDD